MPVDQRRRRAPQVLPAIAALLAVLTACGGKPSASAQPVASASPEVSAEASPSVDASPSVSPSASKASPSPSASKKSAAAAGTTAAANDASRLKTLPGNTTQVVIVQAASASATTASLRAYAKTGGVWQPALSAMTARIGGNGFSGDKHEGDKTTPTGVYSFDGTMYGIAANPGVRYSYHKLVQDDWWDENSSSPGYNTFHHGANPGGPSEPLWQISPQYTYFAVIRYNIPATPGRGSGIFLHQATAGATLGCVSLPQADLVALLRWLNPAANPRIVLSPTSQLSRY
ncbi:L,D-transpeptidase family protein [Dactylosporangium sp. NBC_01737]|uniref:L,D-transpeptidase family protein n=1 Tax=Dactylosporangium sp. NBC_01737 TaxID=2975959 RepID=UPI002E0FAAD9|nr:L,D-transpeptidase family protein [Dactylosporangium sp. NBC_01737]